MKKQSVVRMLLLLYPAKWRNEYGAELEDLLLAERLRFTVVLNVMLSALRQQVRISNHSPQLIRTLVLMTGGVFTIFVLSLLFSGPLWRLISVPVAEALTNSGRPPMLFLTKPFEGFAIIWLELPLLVTAFVAYPLLLSLCRMRLGSTWTPQQKRWATAFVIWSGSMCLVSAVIGFVAWQYGVVLTLLRFEPLMPITTTASVSACFARFARSILAFGVLLQIPVLAFFISRILRKPI